MRHPPLFKSPTTVTTSHRDCDGTHTSHLFESPRMALRASPHRRVRLACRLCLRAHNVSATGLDHNCSRILHPTDARSTAHCTPHCNATSLTASDWRAISVSGLTTVRAYFIQPTLNRTLHASHTATQHLSPRFGMLGLQSDMREPAFARAASHLSPAVVRVGGIRCVSRVKRAFVCMRKCSFVHLLE
jgi:hypothetical protein